MKRYLILCLILLCGVCKIHAAELPVSSNYDRRIQYVDYNEGNVVIVRAAPGLSARIVFAPTEEILDVASGFTSGWEFFTRRNILYVKPKSIKAGSGQDAVALTPETGQWNTNLMVTTNLRMYDIDLRLLPDNEISQVAYRVEFRYPKDEQAKIEEEAAKEKTANKLGEKSPPKNWNYSMQIGENSKSIAPESAYDTGRFTYLRFPNNRDFPTVFLTGEDNKESLVNSHVEGDTLVVHRVAPEMVLRLGDSVVGIYNESYDPDGIPIDEGTTVPGTSRVIVGDLP